MFDSPRDFLNKIWLGWTIYLLALWERFCTTRSDDDREILLRKSGIASADDDSTLRQTVAGGLILSFIN